MDGQADEGDTTQLSEREPYVLIPSPLNRIKSPCLLELVHRAFA